MKNEAEFKTAFKKSVKAQGGFAISLAAPMLAGIPDLYVIMPGFMPVLLEAKWMKELSLKPKKIPYSKLQGYYLNEIHNIQSKAAMGLIGYKYSGFTLCALLPPNVFNVNVYTTLSVILENKLFNVKQLFINSAIPRLNFVEKMDKLPKEA